jgi:hypothetical protein
MRGRTYQVKNRGGGLMQQSRSIIPATGSCRKDAEKSPELPGTDSFRAGLFDLGEDGGEMKTLDSNEKPRHKIIMWKE